MFKRCHIETITEKHIAEGYFWWIRNYPFQYLDEDIRPFLKIQNSNISWLKRVRNALLLSSTEVARRLNISRAAYQKYELGEETGVVTLHTLQKAVELSCRMFLRLRAAGLSRLLAGTP